MQLSTLDDSIFNNEHIEAKGGYRQFYLDVCEKMDVETNWKYNIQKTSVNFDYNDRLEQSMIQSKIRNMFDIEFNKKFQGSLQFPLLQMGTLRTKQMKQLANNSNAANRYRSSNYASFDNRYLFFISDQFDNDKELEQKERDKYLDENEEEEAEEEVEESKEENGDMSDENIESKRSPIGSKRNKEMRNLGFIDDEDSKEMSNQSGNKSGANGDDGTFFK